MRIPRGMPRGRRAIRLPLLLRPTRQHRRVRRLAHNDLRLRALAREHSTHALERTARAEARHEIVEALTLEVVQDLDGGGARMHVGVRLVLELPSEEPAVRGRELFRLLHHAGAALRGGCEHYF